MLSFAKMAPWSTATPHRSYETAGSETAGSRDCAQWRPRSVETTRTRDYADTPETALDRPERRSWLIAQGSRLKVHS